MVLWVGMALAVEVASAAQSLTLGVANCDCLGRGEQRCRLAVAVFFGAGCTHGVAFQFVSQ